MKKTLSILLTTFLLTMPLSAFEGEMGYFGGISPGTKLPTTAQRLEDQKRKSKYTLPYKETIYLTGKPVTLTGTIDLRPGKVDKEKGSGDYTESYIIKATDPETNSTLTRNISLETQFLYDPLLRQMTKTSEVKKWTEVIVIDGNTYQLDAKQSHFSKSLLEDYTPGVMYYRGDLQYDAVYRDVTNGDGNSYITVSVSGPIYGYDQAYAKTETQRRSISIENGSSGYYIEETPTFTMYKDIQYGANEPGAISFGGNYKEIIRGEGALVYEILAGHPSLYQDELLGAQNIADTPSIEQLRVPAMPHLKGHPAEADLTKLYSIGALGENPKAVSPNRAVTKGEYLTMLVKALHIPVPEIEEENSRRRGEETEEPPVFIDVSKEDPLYPYALAAYESGLIGGGRLRPNDYLTREMLYVLNLRAIGLERLGIGVGSMYTPFVDDHQISSWAKSSVYAASKIGLVPSSNGYLFPQNKVTLSEAAALMSQVLDYLRYDLQRDYNEKMMMQ